MPATRPKPWDLHRAILARLDEQDPFDTHDEQNRDALIAVVGWHAPMRKSEQRFSRRPGVTLPDRDRGIRCRSCDTPGACPTIRAIAALLRIPTDLEVQQAADLAWPHGRDTWEQT